MNVVALIRRCDICRGQYQTTVVQSVAQGDDYVEICRRSVRVRRWCCERCMAAQVDALDRVRAALTTGTYDQGAALDQGVKVAAFLDGIDVPRARRVVDPASLEGYEVPLTMLDRVQELWARGEQYHAQAVVARMSERLAPLETGDAPERVVRREIWEKDYED